MHKHLGLSVYVSSFADQKQMLEKIKHTQSFIFTSFHITEEVGEHYKEKAFEMCHWLKQSGFQIIADVSPKTLEFFEQEDIITFAKMMKIDVLRLDYGFDKDEIATVAKQMALAFNASTIDLNGSARTACATSKYNVYAMHNFYPRPETGLDRDFFREINQALSKSNIDVIAFIPGDSKKRGPIFAGLPTLESHREQTPYLAFLDLVKNYQVDHVFVGDILLSEKQLDLIGSYLKTQTIAIPVELLPQHEGLYQQVFTIRKDSPQGLMRLQESRGYAIPGDTKEPDNCVSRQPGVITMDNKLYNRYSGEIQILRQAYPQDDRVNVIGNIQAVYLSIVDCIKNGDQIKLIKP